MRDLKSPIFRALVILLLLAAAILFCISMVDTIYVTEERDIHGYWILLTGWLGFLFFQFAWYANPLTVLSLLLMKRRPWGALIAGILAMLCMSQAFLFNEIPSDTDGNAAVILSKGLGFYCWIGMISCVFYSTIARLIYRALKQGDATLESPATSTLPARYAAQNSISSVSLSYPSDAISTKSNP